MKLQCDGCCEEVLILLLLLCLLLQLSYVMAGWRYFVCPVEFNNDSNSFQVDCEPSELFQLQDYALPAVLESLTGWVRRSVLWEVLLRRGVWL